jgi:biotin transport system substrate-specific component
MIIKDTAKSNSFNSIFLFLLTNKLFLIISFSILTAIAAQVTIPVKPVPFTLQTVIVVLSGAFLGAKNGAYSQVLYLLLGIIGLPVFANTPDGLYGIGRLFGPTGGYLLAFPLAAFLTGYLIEKSNKYINVVLAMFAGNVLIIVLGVFYLDLILVHNFSESLKAGAVIFSLWTVIKVLASAGIYFSVKRYSNSR